MPILPLLLLLANANTARMVALGGTATETIYALGAGERVVGVDQSSLYPPEATTKPNVGYFRAFSAEGVLSLAPTLVVAVEGVGPPAALDQLRAGGVEVAILPGDRTIAAARDRIRAVAALLADHDAGEKLIVAMDEASARGVALAAKAKTKPRVLFVYARGGGTMNVAGKNTGADEIIRLAGGVNVMDAVEGYRPLTSEAAVRAAPDVILVTTHGMKSIGGADALFELPGLAFTPAKANKRVVVMDDLLLLGFGPRVGEAILELARALHPELAR